MTDPTIAARLEGLARDVGRMRYTVDRIASEIETLDTIVSPSAGELEQHYFAVAGDHDIAAEHALVDVGERKRKIRELLGNEER